ncbi:polysaccharide biosynthesis tyrosine autokinase [Flavobacterium johnsoniae]|uniref:non-specific protein-tyrosine kinase n=1 Tax=Flavobacterium johnsoniae (strain ATCC 17061 / DSM 2064 / JCM 8514 / BCRC 14874 / CCUG 350202 / NBRC 14942 / NCIMB 11054 / UW101) TaxID=376686 RepID=A5FN22_FLAJ1|nr:tyrosine-protein kinase domain-containing protein [Flavobacterium johnsoniae]ABQ03396.1 Wzc [Flavobacterium johnsoniae UW101]OXG01189.1 sugar transporter [Flavobacterium johnsoniae UW101]WQG79739.1 polysaccharide biosynthesis tyrosine autokinase [Flavobacterium johnsoniae UW101]SHL76461.1 protein involved in gliding motility EpsB [Flavobacterium johnsoniae]
MLDIKDFSIFENQSNFDFKGFLLKIISYWKWFLLSLIIAFTIAYRVNVRKEKIYGMQTMISIKEESNPFFTSNTSLVFNWGGVSDKVNGISTILQSRSHNEMVVSKLSFYVDYLEQGKYNLIDSYGAVPFYVEIDKTKGQLANNLISIKFLSENEYQIKIPFENPSVSLITYSDNTYSNTSVQPAIFLKRYKVGEQASLPFLNWKLQIIDNPGFYIGKEYFVRFNDFNGTVSRYRGISVDGDKGGGSILTLSMQGTNKARMVEYLNATVRMLIKIQLDGKNQFATNTIRFIDSTLVSMEAQLKQTGNELKTFSKDKNIFDIEGGGEKFSNKIMDFDVQKDQVTRKIAYYNSLRAYLNNSVDYSRLPAPSVAGIEDANIIAGVAKLITLSTQRSEMAYAVKSDKIFKDFDNQMQAVKNVLIENISSAKNSLLYDLSLVNAKIGEAESTVKRLPQEQQELLKIKRKYDLNDNIYTEFLQKRNEAEIVKASNLSDIHFIDPAKDIGGGLIGPKTSVNYILALFLGILVPLMFIFILFFINNSIQNIDDISKLTNIPIIGVIGFNKESVNLAVFDKPKSALSEAFRGVRSSLQFLYKKQQLEGSKTLMITSSISGEGKTFCSINIATVFALSEKKTVIVGLDLRKPRLADEFCLTNHQLGVVNYLIKQNTLEEITNSTQISNLDVILSGPIPPNPSELILGDAMGELINELKQKYDYIILDTPPVGLVSDALELIQYTDVTLYIVRQNYTKKDMITLLNNRVKRGELTNTSVIFNGFENKTKYGSNYGYGYGYGAYSNGYHEEEKKGFLKVISKVFRKK